VTERRGLCDGGGKSPPPDWYKRGAWIDASEIEKRMVDREEGEEAAAAVPKEPVTPLVRQIKASIKVSATTASAGLAGGVVRAVAWAQLTLVLPQFRGGPITVAEYMKEVLTNPLGGFYAASGSEAIGRGGHFITSPEISSLFGEARCCLEPLQAFPGAPVPTCPADPADVRCRSWACGCSARTRIWAARRALRLWSWAPARAR